MLVLVKYPSKEDQGKYDTHHDQTTPLEIAGLLSVTKLVLWKGEWMGHQFVEEG